MFQKSGALLGFSDVMLKYANGPKKSLIFAWFMSIIMFLDDYLNTLGVSFSMRDITDRNRIPREHLAYQANCMAACLCVIIPFTSWTSFTVDLLKEEQLGFSDYVASIPFMFYPILTIICCLLLTIGIIPKIGALKSAYNRVEKGGSPIYEGEGTSKLVDMEMPENVRPSTPLNFVAPVIVMVAVVILYGNSLIHGLIAALAVQLIIYLPQKIMNLSEFFENLLSECVPWLLSPLFYFSLLY